MIKYFNQWLEWVAQLAHAYPPQNAVKTDRSCCLNLLEIQAHHFYYCRHKTITITLHWAGNNVLLTTITTVFCELRDKNLKKFYYTHGILAI